MASNQIVQIQVTQVAAPISETLQQTGAAVSVGSTILSPGTSAVLTQLSDLTPILTGAAPLTSITYSSGSNTATATTTSPHNFVIGDTIELTIAGASPTAYNGTYPVYVTGASTFIYQPGSVPAGSATTPGGYTPEEVSELLAMVTTHFAQGSAVAMYVLELGAQDTPDAITALNAYLTANPNNQYVPGESGFYYVYMLPEEFDAQPGLISILTAYDGDDAQTYFVITSTLSTYSIYTDLMKDAIVEIPTPELGQYPQTTVSSITAAGYSVLAFQIATAQTAGSYVPGTSVLTAVGGTGTEPTFTVTDTKVMTVALVAAGSGTGSGPGTFTGTTGTGTKFSGTCTVTSGVVSNLVLTVPGDYTVNPASLAVEPVTIAGSGLSVTGCTVIITMGVLAAALTTPGNLTAVPANPVATAVSPSGPTGCALTVLWSQTGVATATLASSPGILPGQWFQLAGFSPAAWNGWWQAQAGTTGTTLVFDVPANIAAVTVEGHIVQNVSTSTGPTATEFQAAGVFYDIVSTNPSPTNRAAPFKFRFQFGVTPWPQQGMGSIQLTLKEASVNIIKTGAQGGISTATLFWGTTMDGRDIIYWYSVDWLAINGQVNVANAVINGSNDPTNPLYYDQDGINRLQDVLASTVVSAVSNGLAIGQVVKTALDGVTLSNQIAAGAFAGQLVVNAVPFLTYLTANPNDFRTGTYNGLSVRYIPSQGFASILINIAVTDFVVQG